MDRQDGGWLRLRVPVSWDAATVVSSAGCWSTYCDYGTGALPKTASWTRVATSGGAAAGVLISTIVLIVSGVSSVMIE